MREEKTMRHNENGTHTWLYAAQHPTSPTPIVRVTISPPSDSDHSCSPLESNTNSRQLSTSSACRAAAATVHTSASSWRTYATQDPNRTSSGIEHAFLAKQMSG